MHPGPPPPTDDRTKRPMLFLVVLIVVSAIAAAVIIGLGATGHLGWGIPGTYAPSGSSGGTTIVSPMSSHPGVGGGTAPTGEPRWSQGWGGSVP